MHHEADASTPIKFVAAGQSPTALAFSAQHCAEDAEAQAKWRLYRDNADVDALAWMSDQGNKDQTADADATSHYINLPEGAVNSNMGTLVGFYASVAKRLDEVAAVPGTKGIMLTFGDFVVGIDNFGRFVQPLMTSRADRLAEAA